MLPFFRTSRYDARKKRIRAAVVAALAEQGHAVDDRVYKTGERK